MSPPTLFILYNADASVLGKLNYGYRKLTSSKNNPACAACDITHGGLHLEETVEWKKVKQEIANDVDLKQLHRDELGVEVYAYSFCFTNMFQSEISHCCL